MLQDVRRSSKVNSILKLKEADTAADITGLEREIDRLVHSLYKLTPDQVKLVEASTKK